MKIGAQSQTALSLVMLTGMILTIGLALGFEHLGGFVPCELCHQQRIPYYAAIPLAGMSLATPASQTGSRIARALLLMAAMVMTVGGAFAFYHVGVEWRWWSGPPRCTATALPRFEGDILTQLGKIVPACNQAAWRDPLFDLSLAGWNVACSTLFALVGYRAAFRR